MITIDQMVQNEVMACVSDMVERLKRSDSEFAQYCLDSWPSVKEILIIDPDDYSYSAGTITPEDEQEYIDDYLQALENALEADDAEKAALYQKALDSITETDFEYQEIYEYWLVTDWLAEKLQEQSHFIIDFFNIRIWGRPTTGQSISSDAVIERIYSNLIKGE